MAQARAFVRHAAPLSLEPLRSVIVIGCALALIAAGQALPY
jgi:hypothetical protein